MRKFKCVSCGEIFQHEKGEVRCPKCGSRTLVLLEGDSLRKKSSCDTCSSGTCPICGIN